MANAADDDEGMNLRNARPLVVGALGLAIGAVVLLRIISGLGGNPVILMSFGRDYPPDPTMVDFAREEFGEELALTPHSGHDGKFFYLLARDPLLLHPDRFAIHLDHPGYRAQRIGFPLMASPANAFGPMGVVVALLTLNVVAYGFGTWATAGLARSLGASTWWGMAFPLSIGFLFEMLINGSQIWAAGLAIAGAWALIESRQALGIAALTFAVLCRETALLWVAGAALFLWKDGRRRDSALVLGVPLVSVLAWNLYGYIRLGSPFWQGPDGVIGFPLVGFFREIHVWLESGPVELLAAPAVLALGLVVLWQAFTRPSILTWAAGGWAISLVIMGPAVWWHVFDFTRVAALPIVAFILSFATRSAKRYVTSNSPVLEAEAG